MIDKWSSAMDNSVVNGVVLLDLYKAFDPIDYKLLIKKLKMYRCSNHAINWFISYINDRTQFTSLKNLKF